MRDLVFVDTETTGLEDDAELVELSWAYLTGPIHTLYFGVETVPPFIDDLIGFTERGIAGLVSPIAEVDEFVAASGGNTMVSANPPFDKAVIERNGLWNFHYRCLDIESYALAKIPELGDVPGMKTIYDRLIADGKKLVEPDHTSANDVSAMRQAYHILRWATHG